MEIDSRDSDTLKPPELDELGQLLSVGAGQAAVEDDEIDRQVESFSLVVRAVDDDGLGGFLFGSLERIGGTPCILWGLGVARSGRRARDTLVGMTEELYRRAAITFPDEDVLVAGRFAHPVAYALLGGLDDLVPRKGYRPTGEERAWGRRLAKRYGCEDRYDDRAFLVAGSGGPAAVVDGTCLNGTGGKAAADLFGAVDPDRGDALIACAWALAEDLGARISDDAG